MTDPKDRVSPQEAQALIRAGKAALVDVREPDEHARERIPGAVSVPLSTLETGAALPVRGPVVFHCRSGLRTASAADRLAGAVEGCDWWIMDGGLDAWRKAGLPVAVDRNRPIELQRQVQIAAGSLVAAGTILGLLVSPWFLAVPLFVGSGLTFAGATGFCGMARLLAVAPWNRTRVGGGVSA